MSRTIYVLRHGQTEYNAEQRLQGHCNSPLTATGTAQAQAAGQRLKQLLDDPTEWTFYVSPLGRAQQTARLVCQQLALPQEAVTIDSRLKEMGLGEWETQQVPQLRAICPELAAGHSDWYTRAPGAEPFDQVHARLSDWLLDEKVPDKVVVVAHALSGMILRGAYAQLDYSSLWLQDIPQDALFRLSEGQIERIQY